ncbi:unnamed protein product, partial [Mesorhabditis spiculigera]
MKLTAELGDRGTLEAFSRVCNGIARVCRGELPIRVTPDGWQFLLTDVAGNGGSWLCYFIPARVFTRFVVDGYDEERNEIVLTINADAFIKAISGAVDDRCVIKLTKRDNQPHIQISLFGTRTTLNHLTAVTIVFPESTHTYKGPTVQIDFTLSVSLPTSRAFPKFFTVLKNQSGKAVSLEISSVGELELCCSTEKAELTLYFQHLPVTGAETEDDEVVTAIVRVPVKIMHLVWTSFLQGHAPKITLRISNNRFAVIKAEIEENTFELIIPGLVDRPAN